MLLLSKGELPSCNESPVVLSNNFCTCSEEDFDHGGFYLNL